MAVFNAARYRRKRRLRLSWRRALRGARHRRAAAGHLRLPPPVACAAPFPTTSSHARPRPSASPAPSRLVRTVVQGSFLRIGRARAAWRTGKFPRPARCALTWPALLMYTAFDVSQPHHTQSAKPRVRRGLRGAGARANARRGEPYCAPVASFVRRLTHVLGSYETEPRTGSDRTWMRRRAVRSRRGNRPPSDRRHTASRGGAEHFTGHSRRILFGVASLPPSAGARAACKSGSLSRRTLLCGGAFLRVARFCVGMRSHLFNPSAS